MTLQQLQQIANKFNIKTIIKVKGPNMNNLKAILAAGSIIAVISMQLLAVNEAHGMQALKNKGCSVNSEISKELQVVAMPNEILNRAQGCQLVAKKLKHKKVMA